MTVSEGNNNNNSIDTNEEVFIFPASYGQKRMWFLDQFEPGSPYYNIPVAFKIKGRFEEDLFIKTINKIVDRHESIRTVFKNIKGEPQQVIYPELNINIPVIDLSANDEKSIDNEVTKLATNEARAPFNLATGPLFRVKILTISNVEHIVLITMHHIISDGWSMGILVGEITSIYSSFLSNKPDELSELEIQYADYSEWQNEYLKGEVLNEQLDYWKKKLGNSNSLLELPTDRSRQAIYTNNGSSYHGTISGVVINGLRKLCNNENSTLFMSLVAAFNVLLYRYSGQKDINIGTPIANRTNKDIEKIIGLFINTLVLRTDLSANPTFRDLLKQVRTNNLEAFEHQDLPFEMLVDAIQPERNMSYAPLFQVMIILQNNPIQATQLSELEISMVPVDMGTSTSDITFSLSTGPDGANCSIEYNTDLFDESTISRMFNDFSNLIANIIKEPDKRISEYDILDKITKSRLLSELGERIVKFPEIRSIHSLVERWADKTPNEIAVVDSTTQISYKELNNRANQLAHYLREQNIGQSLPIGISQDKSVNLLISVLAVLKSGHLYLPLDPGYPIDRLEYMIDDSEINLLITDKKNFELFTLFQGSKIVVDDCDDLDLKSKENPNIDISPSDLAYIIYTSGSTGKAKGTMVQHDSLINIYLGWEQDYELLECARNHLQMASFSFDVFGGDWTRALCSGGKLVLVSREQLLDAEELYNIIIKENIEIAEFVPAVLRNLIDFLDKESLILESFKILIAGSDIWYVKEYNEFKKFCLPETRLVNSFGLTETAIDSTFFEDRNLNLSEDKLVPIGLPFPNIQILILDEYLNMTPVGVKGELFIGGVSLARGYYKKPHLTAERFIPNLYSNIPGDRLYKTGDIARFLPDGNIEFLGRSDYQIKLRGFRIELGEIENAISEFKNIKDSVVVVKDDTNGDKRLIAYFLQKGNSIIDTIKLREFVSGRTPDYMIPSAFIRMDQFPLTPNGKIDRKCLPEPDQGEIQKSLELDYIAPRNPTEKIIAGIWSEILAIEKIGIKHNFFLLGGHSLLATQVISRIKTELKVNLPLRFIFEKPTVSDLTSEVEKIKLTSNGQEEEKMVPRAIQENIPLSFAQERLWFLDQIEPNSPFYNMPESYRIKGIIDLNILETCFNDIIIRHESLRTFFISEDGNPYQSIQDSYKLEIPLIDLSNLPLTERDEESKVIIEEESKTPIPISKVPLFRIKIIKYDENDHIFLMTIHHIISDDWSTKVIIKELTALYQSYQQRTKLIIPPLKIQYADYSIWQREWLKDERLQTHIDYWKNQLTGIPTLLELPTDHSRPNVQTFNGDYITFNIPSSVTSSIASISSEENVTSFMLLLTAFKLLLYKLSGQEDICVGTPSANRNREEIEPLVGFFVNTLALRTNCSGSLTFQELISIIKETTLGAYAHQDLPFETIVDSINPERNLSHSPIFQVMFVYQNAAGKTMDGSSELSITPIDSHSKTSKFDLTLFVVDTGDSVGGAFEYNTDIYEKSTIENFVDYYIKILSDGLEHKNTTLSEFELITKNAQRELIRHLNKNDVMPVHNKLLPHQISDVAEKYQSFIAVECDSKQYTFNDFEKQSNKFANYLISIGIKSEHIVGICIPRSYNLIVALVGVLKAGAAYLPIDPNYPQERKNYILSDSGTRAVIVSDESNDLLNDNHVKIVNLNKDSESILQQSENLPNAKILSTNICYVIYTSGSTGKPKGTLITHEGLINYLSWAHFAYPFKQKDGSLVHSTLSFDATITSIFPSLLLGKKIVLMRESGDLDELVKSVGTNNKFSLLKITPAHLELLSNLINSDEADSIADAFIIGGENLSSSQIKYWQTHSPSTYLYNEYGPTEAVVGCVVYNSSGFTESGSVPIGRVIPNMNIYVLDEHLNQVPVGIVGELHIGGISLARGYLKRSDLTSEKFIPNPYADTVGERIYKTGDLVKIQNDGNLLFLGRKDDQVKVRGYRIELGEIESKINEFPFINESVVDIKDYGEDDNRIIAYLVKEDMDVSTSDLMQFLKNELPHYMLPSSIIEIDEIPLTINGKIDRKKLPLPSEIITNKVNEYVAPNTETEKYVCAIWTEVLKNSKIGVHDNFFDLGGHSLLVTKLVVRIEKQFNISVPIKDIFSYPTISELAAEIDTGKYSEKSLGLPSITRVQNKEFIPLSFTQKRLWFLDRLDPNQSIYNMPMALKVNGKLNIEIIDKTIDYLAERHETLRTKFTETKGVPNQIIRETHNIKVAVENFSNLSTSYQDMKVQYLKELEATLPFNIEKDSLIRFRIAILSNERFVIYFTMHHIISDGWSVNIIMEEFITVYSALINDLNPSLPELKIQYSDFAIWQRNYLSGKVLDSQINYWINQLDDQPSLLELPLDKPRPITKTFNGSHKSFVIEEDIILALNELVSDYEITPYMLLLGTFQILLSKLSGQIDISVGTPVANRKHVETEGIIGFFANTLVIRNTVSGSLDIKKYFENVKQTVLESLENQDAPFEKLVEILKPERDLSHTPLFQVMFVLQNSEQIATKKSNSEIELLESESGSAQYDLTLSMNAGKDKWHGTFEFNTDLFKKSFIDSIIFSFKKLLHEISNNRKRSIYELEYLSDKQIQHICNISRGKKSKNGSLSLVELFEKIEKKYHSYIACEYDNIRITYSKLGRKSEKISTLLIEEGYDVEDVIGVMLPHCNDLIEWMLGIIKAGCCYMPIDPNYPEERIQYMIANSGVKAIVCQDRIVEKYDFMRTQNRINIETANDILNKSYSVKKRRKVYDDNLAYLIYTSGSTGKPKGVMLRQGGLRNLIETQVKQEYLSPQSRILLFASISFDASVWEICRTLFSGATVCIVDKAKMTNAVDVKAVLIDHSITDVTLPPSLLQVLDEEGLDNLKLIISAGEKLNLDVAGRWNQNRFLVNGYGPTESTVCVSNYKLDYVREYWNSVPIGSAMNNVCLFILDSDLKMVQRGTIGEIFIGGFGLARGYISRPDLTGDKFIPNPFTNKGGERLYRTGDLGKYTQQGVIEYIGRKDDQVKVRGFRIELSEIEFVLKSLNNIEEAIVIVKGKDENARIVAFVKMISDNQFRSDYIKTTLQSKLPDYMIPGIILEINEIPITPNGKIDRKKLPKIDEFENISLSKYVAPNTGSEEKLVTLWEELLDLNKIGVNDNFFELGGHSLLVTQLLSRIQESFNVNVQLKDLFEKTTVKTQALFIELNQSNLDNIKVKISSNKRPDKIPLSFAQQRLWILDKIEAENAVYNVPTALKLLGQIDNHKIEESLKIIIERHESLRTNFYEYENSPYQVIKDAKDVNFRINSFNFLNSESNVKDDDITKTLANEANYQFDLESDDLFRFTLIKLNDNEHIISFVFHHIITDGWSINLLITEFIEIYYSLTKNIEHKLPKLKLQYADYAIWQRNYLEGEILDKQISYWKNNLANIPANLNMPIDKSRPKIKTFNGNKVKLVTSSKLKELIVEKTSLIGVTPFMILISVFKILLSKYSGQKDIVVGTPIANRNQLDTEQITGFFANTLVLRNMISGSLSFNELLVNIKRSSLEAYSNQDVPFEKLVELIQPDRDLSYSPLFQVMFVLQNNPQTKTTEGNLKIEPVDSQFKFTQYDLTLSAEEGLKEYTLWMEYNTDLYVKSSVELMLERYNSLLEIILTDPEIKISDVSLFENSDKIELIKSFSEGKAVNYKNNNVVEVFENIVSKNGKKIALSCNNIEYSYEQLNERANQIAYHLSEYSLKPEEIVGVMLPKTLDAIASLLGIMKVGCAYLPIDKSFPEKRKKYIVNNSIVNKIITLKENESLNGAQNIYLDEINTNVNRQNYEIPNIVGDNLAYIIYTSGSTGLPKGVMLNHDGLLNLVQNQIRDFNINEKSKVLQFASLSFDASISEIFMALLSGATLYLESDEVIKTNNKLLKVINENQINTITLPPSFLTLLSKEDLPSIENLISAGEALPRDVAEKWYKNLNLVNAYGPSESTIGVSSYTVKDINRFEESIPIGRPINNVSMYILDEDLNLLPNGIVGEIYIGGKGLGRGYLSNPSKTAEVFIPNPFGTKGESLYRTGDTGFFNKAGFIQFLGRTDSQIKVRGYRIELGEIESVLRNVNGIVDAVVDTENNSQILIGYLVYKKGKTYSVDKLKKELRTKLPDYMIPNLFVEISEIPLNINGKVDRKKLPKIDSETLVKAREYVEPRNDIENKLVQIWQDLLDLQKIGIHDNFFELGGHSLLAIQLIGRIDKEFDIELEMVQLFKDPTVAHLSIEILEKENAIEDTSTILFKFNHVERTNPIFFIHPSGGSVHWYSKLANEFEKKQSFYGIQALGIGGKVEPQTSIEEMASTYIHVLKEINPEGPYIVGSWSMGVVIAFEVAYQLSKMDQELSSLIILDQGPLLPNEEPQDTAEFLSRMFMGRISFNLDDLREMTYDEQLKVVLRKAKKEKQFPKFVSLKRFKNYVKILKVQQDAWRNYKIPSYSGNLNLIKSSESHYEYYDTKEYGWEKFVDGNINIFTTAGDHNTMLHAPNVKDLAKLINKIVNMQTDK